MIRIVNLRTYRPVADEVLIKVDRSSIAGNPFPMSSEKDRDLVCDLYQTYFAERIAAEKQLLDVFGGDTRFLNFITQIGKYAEDYDVALGCWCYPKRCHAETIKAYLEDFLY